jgi:DNA-binding beta-propeller fold protein YncE
MLKFYVSRLRLPGLLALCLLILAGCGSSPTKDEDFKIPVFPPPPEAARFYWERTLTSSFDVKKLTSMDKLKAFATGSIGVIHSFAKPYGVAVYQGRIYVTDTVQRVVMMFDAPGRDFKMIGQDGSGQLIKPIGIAVDRNNGTIYVADNTAKRVVVFDKDGKYLRAIGGPDLLRRPTGVAISPDGGKLYIVDAGGVDSSEHHMYIFDPMSGKLLQTIGSRGKEEGQFNIPLQAATAPDGTIYVVDSGNFRVEAFNPDGSFKLSFGGIGRQSGQFSRPKGIAVDPKGNVYVVDAAFGNFQIFSPEGKLLLFVGDRGARGAPAEYMLPAGIAVDEDGRVYMVDQYFKKVDIYRPANLERDQGWLSSIKEKK